MSVSAKPKGITLAPNASLIVRCKDGYRWIYTPDGLMRHVRSGSEEYELAAKMLQKHGYGARFEQEEAALTADREAY